MEVNFSPKFTREYKKLPCRVKDTFEELENIFRGNPFDPKLKTHKLKGKFSGFLSFSISRKYRIIFEFSKDKKTIYFHSVGDHEIYQ